MQRTAGVPEAGKKSENSITILQLTMLWRKTKLWVLNLKDIIM